MSVINVQNANASGLPAAQLIQRFNSWVFLWLQVVGGAAVRIAPDRMTLEQTNAASNTAGGIKLAGGSVAITTGWWIGELWAIGDTVNASLDVEIMRPVVARDLMGGAPASPDSPTVQQQLDRGSAE